MISSLGIDKKCGVLRDIPITQYKRFLANKSNVLWVDITKPDNHELGILSTVFNFHPLAIEDSSRVIELPKIDDFGEYIFVVFHKISFNVEKDSISTNEIDFFLGKNFIISIHKNDSNDIRTIADKVASNPSFFQKRPDFIMHKVMDEIIDNYFPVIDYWMDKIDQIEDKVITVQTEKLLKNIIMLKRDFSTLRRSIGPQRDVINKLARGDFDVISDKAAIYYRDIHDHLLRIYSNLESLSELLTVAFDAYMSTESKKMNITSNKMNIVMQKLTLVSTIFLPLTFLASVYGMNFRNMPELSWDYSYFVLMALMALIAFLLYRVFKKKHLL
ncbi:magnesium/cobalt transporter CorA [Candidatus Woesearchaeota archaeon]|nr:magnesium/cobalt transporter CorA [Candidatus Woesearchaeota archaeon]